MMNESPTSKPLLEHFRAVTGVPMLLNTSFNRADEPIVRTPADALRCAVVADLDVLVLERCVVRRMALEAIAAGTPWQRLVALRSALA